MHEQDLQGHTVLRFVRVLPESFIEYVEQSTFLFHVQAVEVE